MVEVAPYWNVNLLTFIKLIVFIIVEVAPYWNVNFKLSEILFP